MTTFELVWDAIAKKKRVHARYKGHSRVLCPHVLGYKDGREQCLFYQVSGGSDSGLGPAGSSQNWRCIPLDGIDEIELAEGSWYTADTTGHRDQNCVDQVVITVNDQ